MSDTSSSIDKKGRPDLVRFGNTDLYVSRICQGTAFRNMPRSPDNRVGLRVLRHCLDVGLNFFDSANGYGLGGSERLLGLAVAGRRDQAVICTKLARSEIPDGAKDGDVLEPMQYTHDFITRNADRALKRLDTDYIDIYLLHARDGVDARLKLGGPDRVEAFMRRYKDGAQTPPEEIVDTMDALVQAGKIRYWGVSGRNTEEMAEFLQACESTGKSPISCLQNGYNLADRERETEDLFPLLSRTGIGVQSIGPHAAGLLAPGRTAEPGSALADLLNALDRVAGDLGVPRSQVCVAWVLSHPELTTALAAAESPEHVDDNLAGSTLDLPAEAIAALNTASDAYRQRQEAEGKGRAR